MNNSNLPMFLITSNPFIHNKKISYGIIIYAAETGKWLVILRRDSSVRVVISWGSYRKSQLVSMIKDILIEELEELVDISASLEAFTSFYSSLNNERELNEENIKYSYKRLIQCIDIIKLEISIRRNNPDTESDENSWIWIKGKPEKDEDPIVTVTREIKEEIGIDFDFSTVKMYDDKIVHSYITPSGCTYIDEYFVCVIDREWELSIITSDNREVKKVMWMSTQDVRKLLVDTLTYTLEGAMRMLGL